MSGEVDGFEMTGELKEEIAKIVSHYATKRAALLPVLNLIQERYGFISDTAETTVAGILDLAPIKVREVMSFYTLLRKKPAGKLHLQVCKNISCWLAGSDDIVEYLKAKLGIEAGETTPDGRFTLSTVECLCACEIAPMMQVNEKFVGPLTRETLDRFLSEQSQ